VHLSKEVARELDLKHLTLHSKLKWNRLWKLTNERDLSYM